MHLVIVAIGSAGDVHPFLAIGRAAVERGLRVSVCASPAFKALVESCGLRFLPVGSADSYTRAMNDPALWNPRTSLEALWRVIADTLEPLYDLLERESRADRMNTVIVGSLWAFSARVLQETTGLRYFSAQVSPSTLLSASAPPEHARFNLPRWWPLSCKRIALQIVESAVIDRMMLPALNRLRARAGLPATRRVMTRWMHSPDGVLALFPAWFAAPQSDWPAPLTCTGFPLFEPPGLGALPPELVAFLAAGPAPLVVTAGSTLVDGKAFFGNALVAARKTGLRCVLLCDSPLDLPELPSSDVLVCRRVNLPALLSQSAVFAHHGGIGTVALALASGVPQLMLPFAHDQFDNAARVRALGCGIRLAADACATEWAAAIDLLVNDAAFRSACSQVRRLALADAGSVACERALDVIQAAGRPPAEAAQSSGTRSARALETTTESGA